MKTMKTDLIKSVLSLFKVDQVNLSNKKNKTEKINKSKQAGKKWLRSKKTNQSTHSAQKNSSLKVQSHDEDKEHHFNTPPTIPENPFPPRLKHAVEIACYQTEAHPMAVALHYIIYFSSHIGQQRYIYVGNERHYLNVYAILIGRSGKVKGTADSQVRIIEKKATDLLINKYNYTPPRKISGLSTGEGLIESIKDPGDSDENDVSRLDKRISITESEYANVLTQDQRGGNTLSVVLRDAYDGKTLSNITVTARIASNPQINIIGHITPGELKNHKSFFLQSANGALNRNLIFFARREQTFSIPRQYTPEETKKLSEWLAECIYRARDKTLSDNYQDENQGKEIVVSDAAKAVIDSEYHYREADQDAMPELLANMVARHRVFIWRLSAILALLDGTDTVEAEHVHQAYKWLDYSLASIRYILSTAVQEAEQDRIMNLAAKIYNFLQKYNDGQGASSTEINKKLLSGNTRSADITSALQSLIECTPQKIEKHQIIKKGRGKNKTVFKPLVKRK